MEKTAASAGLGAAGRRIGPDIRRDRIQKPGRPKGLFCVSSRRSWSLPARWPSRDNSYDASRCGSASRLSVEASPRALCAIPRNQTATPGLKPMRH